MIDFQVKAMFKRSGHNKFSVFIISQDYDDVSKITIRANGTIYHIFKPNFFRDVQNLYQGKTSMDMTFNDSKYQLLLVEMKNINLSILI